MLIISCHISVSFLDVVQCARKVLWYLNHALTTCLHQKDRTSIAYKFLCWHTFLILQRRLLQWNYWWESNLIVKYVTTLSFCHRWKKKLKIDGNVASLLRSSIHYFKVPRFYQTLVIIYFDVEECCVDGATNAQPSWCFSCNGAFKKNHVRRM